MTGINDMWKKSILYLFLPLYFVLSTPEIFAQTQPDTSQKLIYIARHGWHTGIIFDRQEAMPYLTKLDSVYMDAKFMEISWGDKDYFTSDKNTIWQAVKAVLVPTKSVLLISEYDESPYLYFNFNNIHESELSHEDYILLMSYLNNSLALDPGSQQLIVVVKKSNRDCFYLSVEKYHAFKTCNVWTVRALKRSGLKVVPVWAITSRSVMRQVRRAEK